MTELQKTSPETREGRRAYHTPVLEDYGEVRELTRASSNVMAIHMDGGQSYPAVYSSSV